MREIAEIVNLLFEIYFWIIIVRIFLTWIPSINWYNEPYKTVAKVSDFILDPFRKIVPAVGGIDFSPIIALFVFSLVQRLVVGLLISL